MFKVIVITVLEKEGEDLTDRECEDICDFMGDRIEEIKEELPHSEKVTIEY